VCRSVSIDGAASLAHETRGHYPVSRTVERDGPALRICNHRSRASWVSDLGK